MTKLDWAKDKDYDYTDTLDSKGWAWEFIRRSKSYRKAYKATVSTIKKEYSGDWKKQKIVTHTTKKLENESNAVWMLRADSLGLVTRSLTSSQQCAGQWSLYDMYDSNLCYDAHKIFFDLHNPYPAFFGMMSNVSMDGKSDRERKRLLAACKKLSGVQYVSDVQNSNLINENVLLVAFDTRRPVDDLLKLARPVLVAHGSMNKKFQNSFKNQRKQWRKYIRMLDAVDSGVKIPKKTMIIDIEPEGALSGKKRKKYTDMEERHISSYAVKTLQQAREVADSGFKGILYDIEFKY